MADFQEVETLLTSLRHDLIQKSAEVKTIYAQRDERVKSIADLECTVRDLEDDQDEAEQYREQLVNDLADVEEEIAEKEHKLQEIVPKLSTAKEKETKVKQLFAPDMT